MNPADPFQFLSDVLGTARDKIGTPKLPDWLSHELRNRLLLLINHVLQQHPQAQQQLLAHRDKVLHAQWNNWALHLQITPAGLFALADDTLREHLLLQVQAPGAAHMLRHAMLGQRPHTHITGDAQLADTINWLADNVRWNSEADLARLIGADAAQQVARVLRHAHAALRDFVSAIVPASASGAAAASSADAGPPAHHVPPATGHQPE